MRWMWVIALAVISGVGCADDASYGELEDGEISVGTVQRDDGVVIVTQEADEHGMHYQSITRPNGDVHNGEIDQQGRRHGGWQSYLHEDPMRQIDTWWWHGEQVSQAELLRRIGDDALAELANDEVADVDFDRGKGGGR